MAILTNSLWWKLYQSYPKPPDISHCTDGYQNQCAIRLSKALEGAGISLSKYSEPRCTHGHARGAESLATWLWQKQFGRPRIFNTGEKAKSTYAQAYGIIFFKDCFTRANETVQRGDHIDLWYPTTSGGTAVSYDDPGNKAKQVWFWKAT